MSSNPLFTSHHHTYLTFYTHMSHHVPYALPQRTSWFICIAPSLELVRVPFQLLLLMCGTHSHHIYAMQGHLDNSINCLRLIFLVIIYNNMWLFYVLGTSWGWTMSLLFEALCTFTKKAPYINAIVCMYVCILIVKIVVLFLWLFHVDLLPWCLGLCFTDLWHSVS